MTGETPPPPRPKVREDMRSPVDLPEDAVSLAGNPLRWTTIVIATASLFLLFANASSIQGWAAELPPSALTVPVVEAAQAWQGLTDRWHLGAPRAWLHARWKQAEEARFPGEAPQEE